MIEAFAILLVVGISLAVYVFAWAAARESARRNPSGAYDQLLQHREILSQKLIRGKREHWDRVMMDQLTARLADVDRQIAEKIPPT